MKPETIAKLRPWLGLRGMTCWGFIRDAYRLDGRALPEDYFGEALPLMRIVDAGTETLEPGDIIVIRNHAFATNHCGLMIGGAEFMHSLEDYGVLVSRVDRQPWKDRIVGYLRLKDRAA